MPTEPERGVFINCPFDAAYAPLLEALIFTVQDCGYRVRCSLEADDSGQVRIEKIVSIIGECRMGIHDLSRTELNEAGLPRFNMPFEFGVFLGAQRLGRKRQREKACLVLDREPFRYQAFLSDIAGQDVTSHRDDPAILIQAARDWLNALTTDRVIRGGSAVHRRFLRYRSDLPAVCEPFELDPAALSYHDRLATVSIWIDENP